MFSALFTHLPPCFPSPRPTTPGTGGAAYSTRTAFHLLASLQLAVVAAVSPSCPPCRSPPEHQDEKQHHHHPLASYHHNPAAMRSQGKLALTFALRQHLSGPGCSDEKKQQLLGVVDALERAVDAAFVGQDYRRRIYHLGGLLAADENTVLWDGLRSGRVTAEQVGAGVVVFNA